GDLARRLPVDGLERPIHPGQPRLAYAVTPAVGSSSGNGSGTGSFCSSAFQRDFGGVGGVARAHFPFFVTRRSLTTGGSSCTTTPVCPDGALSQPAYSIARTAS